MVPCLPQYSLARTSPIFDRKGQSKRKRERELPLTFPDQTRPVGITPCFSTLSKILAKELWQNKDNKPKDSMPMVEQLPSFQKRNPTRLLARHLSDEPNCSTPSIRIYVFALTFSVNYNAAPLTLVLG